MKLSYYTPWEHHTSVALYLVVVLVAIVKRELNKATLNVNDQEILVCYNCGKKQPLSSCPYCNKA